jgi:hypothetical protein
MADEAMQTGANPAQPCANAMEKTAASIVHPINRALNTCRARA